MLYVKPWEQTKWLVISSFFFTIPSVYAYVYALYSYAALLFLTSVISANYWRKATYSWRRNMDLVFAKISFVVFASNGIIYVRTLPCMVTGYLVLGGIIYCYYMSNKTTSNWYKYHFMFHVMLACEQIIVLHGITQNSID